MVSREWDVWERGMEQEMDESFILSTLLTNASAPRSSRCNFYWPERVIIIICTRLWGAWCEWWWVVCHWNSKIVSGIRAVDTELYPHLSGYIICIRMTTSQSSSTVRGSPMSSELRKLSVPQSRSPMLSTVPWLQWLLLRGNITEIKKGQNLSFKCPDFS